ncbi:hypothetical protein KIV56_14795 [Cryobacterium breve]|uniref:DUF2569 family protein n=1 Tax=Cryobacterium breve TaxID=1259258 RepID=A0ABY7NCS3_9MICO|nr:hypothetical protein [Cryobacterium breve]WBM79567.1 hypothetical protein KIV56_14795 [Cryobacterium breve]
MSAVLERMLPAWLVRHPLRSGWAWLALWGVVVASDALSPWIPDPGWYAVVLLAALPALAATLWLLAATPRDHLPPTNDSVLSHFFVRFLTLCAAFLVWGVSVVASSSISTAIQAAANDNDAEVTGLGFTLLLAAIPVVLLVLWMAFVVRCGWFLRRLRGWRELPRGARGSGGVPADQPALAGHGRGARPPGAAPRRRARGIRARRAARRSRTQPAPRALTRAPDWAVRLSGRAGRRPW